MSFSGFAQKQPNIIVFMVDDMGWQDCSVPFWKEKTPINKKFHTPAMERMAAEGMKFTHAYATPVCTPTRISLLTGMNAAHHHVTSWTSPTKDNPTDAPDKQLGIADWNYNGLNPDAGMPHTIQATSFVQLLKDAGYFTVHIGKAHWGPNGSPGSSPYNLGFMVNIAGSATGHPQSFLGTENYGNIPNKAGIHAVPNLQQYYGTDTFLTEALTLEALKSIKEPIEQKRPFFLYLSHYAVHQPITADKRFYQKYIDAGLDPLEARYASMIEGMDKSLGDVMDFLQKEKVDKNTIIIFMSDNGGLSNPGTRGGQAYTHNLPLKAGKGSVHEGGIREPMLVKWPKHVKPGSVANQYVIIEDFFPTILEAAKVKNYNTLQKIDGQSFLPVLKNATYTNNNRYLIWHMPNKWIGTDTLGINYSSAIRQGDWKMVYSIRTGKKELYNLTNDIGENNDVAKQYPDKLNDLSTKLYTQLKEWQSPMPIDKSTGKPVPYYQ
ncbi:MAG: sulfatase [Niabella sp.]